MMSELWAELKRLGAVKLSDVALVREDDLRQLGMLPLQCRRFLEEASALRGPANPDKAPPAPVPLPPAHAGGTDAHRELEALMAYAATHARSGFQARSGGDDWQRGWHPRGGLALLARGWRLPLAALRR
jgi:hypothetical protein